MVSRGQFRWFTPGIFAAALGCGESAESPTASAPAAALDVTSASALRFHQVSAGLAQSCAVTPAGVGYCWPFAPGAEPGRELRPARVLGELEFRMVNAEGFFHTCGVTTRDVAFCWGSNNSGQLGTGTEPDRRRPNRVAGGLRFRQVSGGQLHTCGVTTANVAYCWGHNQAGELGDGTTTESNIPVQVAGGLAFEHVTAGEQFSCGVTTDHRAYCWGMNTLGQLGIGTDVGPESCFTGDNFDECSTTPVRVARRLAFREVNSGGNHTCGVTVEAAAYCWGINTDGELGVRTHTGPELCAGSVACSTRPVAVAGRLAFAAVSGGLSHTCGVTQGGAAWCWGTSLAGELGIGGSSGLERCSQGRCSARPLAVLGGLTFRAVSAGGRFTCGVTVADVAYCWGTNEDGQLGDGTRQHRVRPRRVDP